ncbi:hypothetical protein D5R40_29240 [Okeania hirsuta]|uniref:Uncharacterized protein n=1 Tax=Okeania hirsuta TaxID=1458930 RepID=A0A3N6NSC9_9CYAN|nr:hypothetical protein D4Z78_14920 [Okeania hirsuta]RQH25740.1 hypothetical protein D5R40_29240 [Okeania hirsuta]
MCAGIFTNFRRCPIAKSLILSAIYSPYCLPELLPVACAQHYKNFTKKLWSKVSPFKRIKKENIPDVKPPDCRVTVNAVPPLGG